MLNLTLQLKVKQRLNKLDSQDYDNILCWQIIEAFNKRMILWVRRQITGTNIRREGDEQSKRRIDDLQILLKQEQVLMVPKENGLYYESATELPADFLEFKRVDTYAKSECCPDPKPMVVYLAEEANVPVLLRDKLKQPNYEWGETFMTLMDNRIRIYANEEFVVQPIQLYYYRKPINIEIVNCSNPYTGVVSAADVECEFKDDIVELLIDEACAEIAGDIESGNQYTRETESGEKNN